MNTQLIQRYLIIIALLLLQGCGGGGDGGSDTPPPPPLVTTSTPEEPPMIGLPGSVVKGPLANATVDAYRLDVTGKDLKGELVATGATDDQAQLAIHVPDDDGVYVLEFIATANTVDLSTGTHPTLSQFSTLTTPSTRRESLPVYATPHSTLVLHMAANKNYADAESFIADLDNLQGQVKSTFGFGLIDDIDLMTTPPVIDASVTTTDQQTTAVAYRTAIEALNIVLANVLSETDNSNASADELLTEVGQDLTDGTIDASGDTMLYTAESLIHFETPVTDAPLPNDPQSRTLSDIKQLVIEETSAIGNPDAATDQLSDVSIDLPNQINAVLNSDLDGDGIPNHQDSDDDGDAVPDLDDAFPSDPTETEDTDNNGVGDNQDLTSIEEDSADPVDEPIQDNTTDDNTIDIEDDVPPDTNDTENDTSNPVDENIGDIVNDSPASDQTEDNSDDSDSSDASENDPPTDPVVPEPLPEPLPEPVPETDTDGDGTIDAIDKDDDNDGVDDDSDAFPLDSSESTDTDQDGVGNNADNDDDNDGTLDAEDHFPFDRTEQVDTDGDSIGNNADSDDDNDGTLDTDDHFPLDPAEQIDTDGDSIGNNADNDDDNDGIDDVDDAFPLAGGWTEPTVDFVPIIAGIEDVSFTPASDRLGELNRDELPKLFNLTDSQVELFGSDIDSLNIERVVLDRPLGDQRAKLSIEPLTDEQIAAWDKAYASSCIELKSNGVNIYQATVQGLTTARARVDAIRNKVWDKGVKFWPITIQKIDDRIVYVAVDRTKHPLNVNASADKLPVEDRERGRVIIEKFNKKNHFQFESCELIEATAARTMSHKKVYNLHFKFEPSSSKKLRRCVDVPYWQSVDLTNDPSEHFDVRPFVGEEEICFPTIPPLWLDPLPHSWETPINDLFDQITDHLFRAAIGAMWENVLRLPSAIAEITVEYIGEIAVITVAGAALFFFPTAAVAGGTFIAVGLGLSFAAGDAEIMHNYAINESIIPADAQVNYMVYSGDRSVITRDTTFSDLTTIIAEREAIGNQTLIFNADTAMVTLGTPLVNNEFATFFVNVEHSLGSVMVDGYTITMPNGTLINSFPEAPVRELVGSHSFRMDSDTGITVRAFFSNDEVHIASYDLADLDAPIIPTVIFSDFSVTPNPVDPGIEAQVSLSGSSDTFASVSVRYPNDGIFIGTFPVPGGDFTLTPGFTAPVVPGTYELLAFDSTTQAENPPTITSNFVVSDPNNVGEPPVITDEVFRTNGEITSIAEVCHDPDTSAPDLMVKSDSGHYAKGATFDTYDVDIIDHCFLSLTPKSGFTSAQVEVRVFDGNQSVDGTVEYELNTERWQADVEFAEATFSDNTSDHELEGNQVELFILNTSESEGEVRAKLEYQRSVVETEVYDVGKAEDFETNSNVLGIVYFDHLDERSSSYEISGYFGVEDSDCAIDSNYKERDQGADLRFDVFWHTANFDIDHITVITNDSRDEDLEDVSSDAAISGHTGRSLIINTSNLSGNYKFWVLIEADVNGTKNYCIQELELDIN